MKQILPKPLWVGTARDARDGKTITSLGIVAVVDLALEEPPAQLPRDIAYLRFPLLDGEGNVPSMLRAAIHTVALFMDANMPTLVTCGGGMSRSPAIVAAAIAQVERIDLHDALARIAAIVPHDVSTSFWKEVSASCKQ